MWWRALWTRPVQNKSGIGRGAVFPVDATGHGVTCKWVSGLVDIGFVGYEVLLASVQGHGVRQTKTDVPYGEVSWEGDAERSMSKG